MSIDERIDDAALRILACRALNDPWPYESVCVTYVRQVLYRRHRSWPNGPYTNVRRPVRLQTTCHFIRLVLIGAHTLHCSQPSSWNTYELPC